MPFTGSHPAAVLPMIGGRIPASALVIGTLVPDLPYYFPIPVHPSATHAWHGVVGIDVVFGIALFLLWHLILVPPLLWGAPGALQRRIPDSLRNGGRITRSGDLVLVCLGLVIAGFTHVALDSLTHANMWPVMRIEYLSTPLAGLALYRWLHLVLSVLGLTLLAWYLARWWRQAALDGREEPIAVSLRWGIAGGFITISALGALRAAAHQWEPGLIATGQEALIAGIIAFFSILSLAVLVAAVVWHVAVELGQAPAG